MNHQIANLFYPKSICIAGVSSKEKSIGYELLKTILSYNFTGKIFAVNPKSEEILGLKCYKSIYEIDAPIDLALVVVPKKFVDVTIDELITKGVKSIVLITAGFKEVGIEGHELEKQILNKVRKANARMTGPNCMGVISTLPDIKLNATFVAEKPETGSMAFLSQSGAFGAAVLNSLRETDIRFAHFISVGNKADLNENDFLEFWETDKNIGVTTYYLESFENGFNFIKPFMLGEINKPAIVLKSGKTKSGMKAASSHTGALSAQDKIVDALMNQFGIIRVNDLNEMFNTAKGFENFPMPAGNRIAVVTNAGGPAILSVDKLEAEGLRLAELSEDTKKQLRELVHPEGSVSNPVDLLPGGNSETYKQVNEVICADKNVDAVVSIFVEPVMVEPMSVIEAVNSLESGKPIFQVAMPTPEFWENYRSHSVNKKPIFRNPEDPAEIISNMLFCAERKQRIFAAKNEYKKLADIKPVKLNFEDGYADPVEVHKIAQRYSIPVCEEMLVDKSNISSFYEIDFPIVIKAVGKELVHKSDLGAAEVDIKNKNELTAASDRISERINNAGISFNEFQVQEFLDAKHELLVGGFRDPSFGPVIMFGAGGKYVEVFGDTQIKSAYASRDDLLNLINGTKIGRVLKGVRGEESIDTNKLLELLHKCCKLLIEKSNIMEFDINPLIVTKNNILKAVDIRIKIEN